MLDAFTPLYDALGPLILRELSDPNVKDVELNPDGQIFVDRIISETEPRAIGGMSPEKADAIIRFVASHMGVTVTPENPRVAGTLPSGERFQGMLPPIVARPCFVIRKPPGIVFKLGDYVKQGILTEEIATFLTEAAANRLNILIAGGTGSGKTTLVNALLATEPFREGRIVIVQDVDELRCEAPNHLAMLTKPTEPAVDMRALIKDCLRLNPTRIVIGEVRDGSALDLLHAWNTGHPGGVATVHANSALDALYRLEDLISEVSVTIPKRAIAGAMNVIVFIERTRTGRRVTEVAKVRGHTTNGYVLEKVY